MPSSSVITTEQPQRLNTIPFIAEAFLEWGNYRQCLNGFWPSTVRPGTQPRRP
jgi:hypothetical protein